MSGLSGAGFGAGVGTRRFDEPSRPEISTATASAAAAGGREPPPRYLFGGAAGTPCSSHPPGLGFGVPAPSTPGAGGGLARPPREAVHARVRARVHAKVHATMCVHMRTSRVQHEHTPHIYIYIYIYI